MHRLTACRICQSDTFESIVDFGSMAQGGLFPRIGIEAPRLPLHLVQCLTCGLVQLGHQLDVRALYGDHYGYRSGLNQTMIDHLTEIAVDEAPKWVSELLWSDAVLDIGSNDGTLLKAYSQIVRRVGVDPSMTALRHYYQPNIETHTGFFDDIPLDGPFKVITSIAMFYDLDHPVGFARKVCDLLHEDGVWILEQGYWPALAKQGAYDVICHEHLTYYSLADMITIMDLAGLTIKAVSFNAVNGGSFRLVVGKHGPRFDPQEILIEEQGVSIDRFRATVHEHGPALKALLTDLRLAGKTVYGYGASTKGNTVLQHAGIGPELLPCILDVSESKAGCWTPGTHIPIVLSTPPPDYYLVLPWHYRESILQREEAYLKQGGGFIFPLPTLEVVWHAGVRGGANV